MPVVAPARDTVVTSRLDETTIDSAFVPMLLAESVTSTVNEDVPAFGGVPEITPVDAFSVSPVGRLPVLIDHVYGEMPPLTDRV